MEENSILSLSVLDKGVSMLKETTFIQNGHIAFKEERLLTENHKQVAQAIIKFREWRATFEAEHSTVIATDIPKPFTDLIALLAHESEETLDVLVLRIDSILQPFNHNISIYKAFLKAIKQIIKVSSYQERYGLADVVLLSKGSPSTIPKRLIMFRWQAHDTSKFPSDILQVTTKRKEKRKSFSRMFTNAFQILPEAERIKLLCDDKASFVVPCHTHPDTQKEQIPAYNIDDKKSFFNPFKEEEYVSIPSNTKRSRKRLCSSFDTLFYVGLNSSFDLKQRFLDELPTNSKRKRGITNNKIHIDIGKLWLASTTTRTGKEKNQFFDSAMYRNVSLLKMKLLQFHEDVRPAYYGTWSKAYNGRNIVNGRRPFAKDTLMLNYDYDSEAEWDHDVDCEDIHTLDPDEDEDMLLLEVSDEENSDITVDGFENDENEEGEIKWVVPEGYLSDDEGIQDKRKPSTNKVHKRVTSRPVKWPISANKHFPMKSVIIGPSFETKEEPQNHPLSDFKIHMIANLDCDVSGYPPFNTIKKPRLLNDTNLVNLKSSESTSLPVYIAPSTSKTPHFQREIDKIVNSDKEELISVILDNKTKTMMGLVTVIKSKKIFCEYTTAQLQAMIHEIAIQEIKDTNTEYNWYLRN